MKQKKRKKKQLNFEYKQPFVYGLIPYAQAYFNPRPWQFPHGCDEELGVHLAQQMEQESLPDYAMVLDGGTGGFHLMGYLEDYPIIIAVDATLDNHPFGTIRLIRPHFSKDFPRSLSIHDIGLRDLMEGLQILGKIPQIHLFVVSIASIQPPHIGLSEEIQTVLPILVKQVQELTYNLCKQATEVA